MYIDAQNELGPYIVIHGEGDKPVDCVHSFAAETRTYYRLRAHVPGSLMGTFNLSEEVHPAWKIFLHKDAPDNIRALYQKLIPEGIRA